MRYGNDWTFRSIRVGIIWFSLYDKASLWGIGSCIGGRVITEFDVGGAYGEDDRVSKCGTFRHRHCGVCRGWTGVVAGSFIVV